MIERSTNQPGSSSAALRLTRSRIALRKVLRDNNESQDNAARTDTNSGDGISAGLRDLKGRPGAQLLMRALQQMWAKNPWHILGSSAVEAAEIVLAPVAQRSPIKLVTGAFAIGSLLYLVKPWRMVKKSALLAGLLTR